MVAILEPGDIAVTFHVKQDSRLAPLVSRETAKNSLT